MSRDLSEKGLSYREIINGLKVEQAKKMLKDTNLSLSEISMSLGYSTNSHFTRAFKNVTGLTPSIFRSHQIGSKRKSNEPDEMFSSVIGSLKN
ncbi:helix-turn-helix domain-containing protein [Thiomicrorhabdus sediminis]|uniref:helix-turn-helix domain-containing protein n=1 Tax=Thiomicrorhabdus sediminis TaxID=2580412 RepID=UPI00143CDA89|nr:helix-turn-helix transcriptional regulator [Thiomicrorhabdus sediminis]